jgi:type II secretory pathway component PulM
MVTLQSRERRLLILAGIVAAIVVGYLYVVEPLVDRHERVQGQIQTREQLLAHQQRLVARRDRYVQERKELASEIERRRGRLLPGDKTPLAASELQKLVKGLAQDAGVEVRSERILPTTDRGGYTEVPVEVTLAGPIRALVTFFHRLDGVPAQISVQDLKIRVVSVAAPKELLATLQVTGYIATATPEPERGRSEPRRPGA